MKVKDFRVGDVLSLKRRVVVIDPMAEYELIGVYSFGKGIFHREPMSGAELGDYRFFRIEPQDLVLSNIQAWEGAIGLASERNAGAIGTHRFLTYVPVDERINTNWARWFFLSERGMDLIRKAAPGTTVRNRTLAIERFEDLEIPLPEIERQRMIANRLDRIEAGSRTLAALSDRAGTLTAALGVSTAARRDLNERERKLAGWRRLRLGSVMTPAAEPVAVEADSTYRNVGIYSYGRGLFAKADIEGSRTSARTLFRIRVRQFIYSRLFAFEGAYTYVTPEFDGCYVSNEFPTFDPDPQQLDARWLAHYIRSPDCWEELRGKGIGVRRQRVPIEAVLDYEVWLPPIAVQREIVKTIDRVNEAEMVRQATQQLGDSLLRAALNEAFAELN